MRHPNKASVATSLKIAYLDSDSSYSTLQPNLEFNNLRKMEFHLHLSLKNDLYLNMRKEAALEQQRRNAMVNRVLTDDETALIVSTCRELSMMGLRIDEDTCLKVTNSILCERIAEKYFVPVTRGVVKQII